jgi:hypothetical protein
MCITMVFLGLLLPERISERERKRAVRCFRTTAAHGWSHDLGHRQAGSVAQGASMQFGNRGAAEAIDRFMFSYSPMDRRDGSVSQ